MPHERLSEKLWGRSAEEFSAVAGDVEADYTEGRVVVGEDGWIVSQTEMRLLNTSKPGPADAAARPGRVGLTATEPTKSATSGGRAS